MERSRRDSVAAVINPKLSSRTTKVILGLLTLWVIGLLAPGSVLAQSELPAYRAPMLDQPATPATFRSGLGGPTGSNQAPVTDEIKELARGLRYDPGNMYKFVHDYIEWEPTWGDTKGASMTWMDRSGNAFDQASLMIALLEQAVLYNTELTITNPKYVVGEIHLTQAQAWDWLGMSDDVTLGRQLLARGGLYGTVTDDGQGGIASVRLIHAWVKVTINGQTYEFDPSYKIRENENGLSSTALNSALGYDRYDFFDDAEVGATIVYGWPSYVTNINQTNINNNLNTYSANLTNYIKTNYPEGDLRDVIGGRRIQPVELSDLPPTSPSYTVISRDNEFVSTSMPDLYRTTLRIQYRGIDKTFLSSDIYGRRLSLDFDGSNRPQLILDGTVQATGSASTPGTAYDLTLTVDHPYDSSAFDCAVTVPVKAGGFYAVVNGWGDTGKKILAQHRNALELHRYEGAGDTSEKVLGESYTLVGLTWLAQTSRMRQVAARFGLGYGYFHVVNHHMLGLAGHYDTPYLSIPLGHLGLSTEEDTDERNAMFRSMSDHANAYQEQIIRQLQDAEAVSAGRLIEMTNKAATYNRIYDMDSAHWASTEPQLYGYSQAEKDLVEAYADAGYDMSLPQNGNLSLGSWTGSGFKAFNLDGSTLCAAYIIGDQCQGGSSGDSGAVNAAEVYTRSDIPAMRSSEGAHTHAHTDLTVGNGGLPFGLSFSRQYSSARRLQDGPVGLGWTHNLDIAATVLSDSFQSLGDDSALDAVPHIVSLYVNWDLLNYPGNLSTVVSTVSQAWLLDQVTDNLATIRQGAGRMHFVKAPDGSYREPTGQSIKLLDLGAQTFRLKDSRGKYYDFNANGTLAQWSDVFGNVVDFSYSSGKLTQVASKIGGGSTSRSLTLNYSGGRITSVTDSASRSISLAYNGTGQLISYTNLDGTTTTYGYDATYDGRLTKLYIPTDQVNPYQTTVYDSLGRVKQRINALGTTWDYFLAGYRAEVLEPAQTDPNNVTQRFSTVTWLNRFGLQILSIDQLGRKTTAEYDNLFRPTRITNPTGMATEYEYDENNNVIQTGSLCKPGSLPEDPNLYSQFGYTSFETNGRWFLLNTYTQDPNGFRITHTYDTKGSITKSTYPEVDTPSGPATPEITFTYNTYGQVLTQTDPAGTVTKYEYFLPSQGAGLKKTIADYGGLNLTAELTYDAVGNVITTKDPKGNISQSEYYPSRLLKKTTAPSPFSYQTTYEYNANGWLLHVKQNTSAGLVYHQSITYTAAGQKATVRGPYKSGQDLGINLTTYTYDALGRTWKVTDAEGNITETRYYPDGRVWKVIDAEGHDVVTNTYNDDGSLQKVVDAEGNATEYEYNGFMGLKKTIYEDGTYTQTGYDGIRRMDYLRTRAGDVIIVGFDSMNRVKTKIVGSNTTSYTYDITSRLASVSDDAGTITNTYDAVGRLTQTNDAHSKVIAYQYDDNGQRTRLTYPDSSYISYEYDVLNRLTKIKDDSLTTLSEYTYDERSRCTDVDYANGASLDYQYDVANRLLSIDNSTDTDDHDYDYTYDKVGNRLTMTVNSTEEHSYTYDDIYQITEVDYPTGYGYLSEDTVFNYDDAGNRTSVIESTTPSHTASYVTNALNQYKSVDGVWYGYDDNGNITHDSEFNYSYDEENRLIGITPSAGGTDEITAAVETDLSFSFADDANWVNTSDESYYNNDSARSGTITHSQKATMQATVEGPGTISFYWKVSSASSDRLRFFVDASMELYVGGTQGWTLFTEDVTGMGSHILKWRYQKDSSGSSGEDCVWIDKVTWTPKVPTWSTMYATASDKIFMGTDYYGSPVTQYYFECLTEGGHDSGWQSSWYYTDTNLSSGQTYRYRVKGRDSSQNETGWSEVKSATTTGTLGTPADQEAPDWANIAYTYDAAGRRITKDVDCILTKYIYDGSHVIAEYDTDGSLLRKFIYGPGTDNPVCMIEVADSNAVYYYHRDGLGNVIALSDSAGDTVQTYEYTIYGQVAASDPNHTNPYMFTGRRFEPETGLYYYRARIYNPYIGRFLQTDPIGYSDGINWYAYCGNNPGNYLDPSGMITIAFYDGEETGLFGDAFMREMADDDYFDLSFDISYGNEELGVFGAKDLGMSGPDYIILVLEFLSDIRDEITDIYFFDHGYIVNDELYLEFGDRYDYTENTISRWSVRDFATKLRDVTKADNPAIQGYDGTRLHFRHCQAGAGLPGYADDKTLTPLLNKFAEHSRRLVSGCAGDVVAPALASWVELPGPDYRFEGPLMYSLYYPEDDEFYVGQVQTYEKVYFAAPPRGRTLLRRIPIY